VTKFFSNRPVLAQYLVCSGLILIACLINAVSVLFDIERVHSHLAAWKPYCWELSSWFGWAVTLALLLPADDRLAARKLALPLRLFLYLPIGLACSVLHVALMVGLRVPVHALAGETYDFGPLVPTFFYEFRKDLLTLILAFGIAALWRKGVQRHAAPELHLAVPSAEPSFLVPGKDGDVLVRAGEIDWIEAQGNYVALHVGGQEKLLRQTMKEIEARLADKAFIRTHRSALVNMRKVKAITRGELGEIRVEFETRDSAPLSSSRRAEVMKALEAH
jgi:hypothetical protein